MNRWIAFLAGIIVTVLWSSSYIINEWAFNQEIKPLTLAGMRYMIAATFLAVFIKGMRMFKGSESPRHSRLPWGTLILIGLTGFTMAQGLQYSGQFFLNPTQTSLLLSIGNTCMVLLVDFIWMRESQNKTSLLAFIGLATGVLLYFFPWDFGETNVIGIGLVLLSSIGYALNLTINRHFIHQKHVRTEDLVIRPMFIGALSLLIIGLSVEGIPPLNMKLLFILLWLGVINGGLAFYLWTWTQKHLKAFESSLINNLMLVEIAFLDVLLLGRNLSPLQVIGILCIAIAVAYVQLKPIISRKTTS